MGNHRMKLGLGLASAIALAAILPSKPSFAQSAPSVAPALADAKDPAERKRVEELIEGARKEGVLSWIGVQIEPEHAEKILASFKAYYGLNDLRGEYVYTSTGELITRVEQLLRVKHNTFDVSWTVAWAWYKDLVKRKEMMKYESPYYKDYTLSDEAKLSLPGYWVSDAYAFAPLYSKAGLEAHGVKDFVPDGWGSLTDPRLKGQISVIDVINSSSAAPLLAGIVKVMGEKWLTDYAKNQPVLCIKTAQCRDWVASSEFPVASMNSPKDALSLINRNVQVKLAFPKEGVLLFPFAPIIFQSAPHPNAAKLFIDFVRSEKGAKAVLDAGGLLFFGRPGVKSSHPDLLPAWEDVKVIPFDWDTEGSTAAVKKVREKAREAGLGR